MHLFIIVIVGLQLGLLVSGFRPAAKLIMASHRGQQNIALSMALDKVNVYKTKDDVALALCSEILEVGSAAIDARKKFCLAVPGGSVLKMLSKLSTMPEAKKLDWSKVFLYYVNHKVVPPDDPSSTHLKAESLFLKEIGIPPANVAQILNDGTLDMEKTAKDYQKQIAKNVKNVGGLPYFDYMVSWSLPQSFSQSPYPGLPRRLDRRKP